MRPLERLSCPRHLYNFTSFLSKAFLSRGDFNVFFVDWGLLTRFPCYFSALNNMKLVSQCTAQLYAHLTHQGALMKRIICIGHSLGAHICGMIANYSTLRPSRILGLDPAGPIINDVSSSEFRLTSDDADFVEVIHTNAGVLGTDAPHGTVDFCVNGGHFQPQCSSIIHPIRRHRCSHFQGICLISSIVGSRKRRQVMGYPCLPSCPMQGEAKILSGKPIPMGMGKPIPGSLNFPPWGLDPAGPIINDVSSSEFRLTSDDADFVEVIHTNAGVLGTDAPHGTVDFCVNGGHFQPQCSSIIHPIRADSK
ncbi:hypothetical protein J437_LFUL005026 [Ladona fulva]|uniref:Lipase domain-containing protein n=1 Tax=Ladona fulva TaxID=123851 RepID=A0A8K0JUB5_LADFU|nr:hypothetical protein J437_LFUL005026 [Ladona fulva]